MGNDADAQRDRIDRIVKELFPHGLVKYDATPDAIGFAVLDNNTSTVLAATSTPLRVHELTGRSDDWLRKFISQLGGGDI
jgi:hypothetical protein